jgi:hypothetical protein
MKGRFRDFRLCEDGFEFRGTKYPDSIIRHIFLNWAYTTIKINFVRSGGVDAIRMIITTTGGERIVLQESESDNLFANAIREVLGNRDDAVLGIHQVAQALMKRTVFQRTAFYADEWKEKGYFTYDECKFYPPERIVFRGREFPLKDSVFLKGARHIEMRPKDYSFGHAVKRHLSLSKIPQFNTQTDPDVIFGFLKNCFGLSWE